MPIFTEQRKRQKNLMIVVSLVIMVTLAVLYFGRLKKGLPETATPGDSSGIAKGAREIQLNLKLLKDPRFKGLIPYETISGVITTGRNNPFAPYGATEPVYIHATSTSL